MCRLFLCCCVCLIALASFLTSQAQAQTEASLKVHPDQKLQAFDGMGCGSIFYGGHITSFSKRNKNKLQQKFYDELFSDVRTNFLHVMIRPDFEAANDNDDPYLAEFADDAFKKNQDLLEVCRAAKKRRPDMKIYATLYTPPPWMKTNNAATGAGKKKATLKDGLNLECAEYMWAYLKHMHDQGQPVDYLSISNECDFTHTQPSYFLNANRHAKLFKVVVKYLDEMQSRFPDVPQPLLVAPNGISAINAAKRFLPALGTDGNAQVDVIGSHDYDRRPGRWEALRKMAGDRPVWCTEWCWNGKDWSPGLIQSANSSWSSMTDGFNAGLNVWMAYDWTYPPRPGGGEAMSLVEWGKSYEHTKMYYSFAQWCNALEPGMHVVKSKMTAPEIPIVTAQRGVTKNRHAGVKACAFSGGPKNQLVIHVVNLQAEESELTLQVTGAAHKNAVATVTKSSAKESNQAQPEIALKEGKLVDRLKPNEMATYVFAGKEQSGATTNRD